MGTALEDTVISVNWCVATIENVLLNTYEPR